MVRGVQRLEQPADLVFAIRVLVDLFRDEGLERVNIDVFVSFFPSW
jgi:hypothetical protein